MNDDTPATHQHTLSYMIAQVGRAHRARAQMALATVGLHVGQEMILLSLWQQDGLTASQLVEQLCTQPATVTKMLNRMEKSGVIERRPDPADGRARRIYLTAHGHALQAQTAAQLAALEQQTQAALSTVEQAELYRLLGKVLSVLQTDEPPTESCPPCDM